MSYISLLAVAVALAMDALAVAIATGLRLRRVSLEQTLRMAGIFGLFQAGMPVFGWLAGAWLQHYFQAYGHWLAFGLLAFVAVRMLKEAWEEWRRAPGEERDCPDPTRGATLLVLALATSIDALAVGFSLALLQVGIWLPALVIGGVCFAITAAGMHIGRLIRGALPLGYIANIAGALALLLIGLNILREHGTFS